MRERTLSIYALTMLTAMVSIYSFMAGVSMLFAGAIGAYEGSSIGGTVFALGAVFFVLSVSSAVVAVGVWYRMAWTWAVSIAISIGIIAANVALSFVATNFVSVALPAIGAAISLAILARPATRAYLLGTPQSVEATSGAEALDASVVPGTVNTPA